MTTGRAGLYVALLAAAAYGNSLGNGFAFDDNGVIALNPVVTSGSLVEAATTSYWPDPMAGGGLYRPFTSLSFALEWRMFEGNPMGFHAVNVALHALVSLLFFLLMMELGASAAGGLVGAGIFAVHPLHTEAVANVVGRAELYAGCFYLLAALLYLKGWHWRGWLRGLRLVGLAVLYALSLGSKEIGVTLPGVLLLLEWYRSKAKKGDPDRTEARDRSLARRVQGEAATYVLLAVTLLAFLGARYLVLGAALGDVSDPVLLGVDTRRRILIAASLWPQYLRLLLFPFDLVADYTPAVIVPPTGFNTDVFLGMALAGLVALVGLRAWRSVPLFGLGLLWFLITILPVSHLLFPAGVLLAERTLYLPSISLGFALAGFVPLATGWQPSVRRLAAAFALAVGIAFLVKTVHRNPAWMSTWTVLETLNEDHPEAFRAVRARATGLDRVGESGAAGEAFLLAATLAPNHHGILVEAGHFFGRVGDWDRGESLLRRAIRLAPDQHNAYRALAGQLLRQERGREAHQVALSGLNAAGPDGDLWGLLSESYVLKGDLQAAIRAREAALGQDPASPHHWIRLADLLEAEGNEAAALQARSSAETAREATHGKERP